MTGNNAVRVGNGRDRGRFPPTKAGDLLCLAATPAFAAMALATILLPGLGDELCATGGSPLTGMAPMYLLMSAFHAGPWLAIFRRSS